MLRIFFGPFHCNTDYNLDQAFHMFTEGKTTGGADYVHTRLPVGHTYSNFDEYIDLFQASIEPEWPETITEFIDIVGISHPALFQDNSFDTTVARPANLRTIETDLSEFFLPTRLLSYPVPNSNYYRTPLLQAVNETYEADRTQTITGYRSFTINREDQETGGQISYAPERCVVPIVNANTDQIKLSYNVLDAGATGSICKVHRATIEYNEISQRWLRSNMECEIDNATIPADVSGWQESTSDYADATSYPYVTPYIFAPFEPLNDAIARTGLEFEKNIRVTGVGPLLILNVETHQYFKGWLKAVSPAFTEGIGKRTGDQAILVVQIIEEGKFLDAALTDPNTVTNFTEATRSYV